MKVLQLKNELRASLPAPIPSAGTWLRVLDPKTRAGTSTFGAKSNGGQRKTLGSIEFLLSGKMEAIGGA